MHPHELTATDQEKAREKDDDTEKVSRQLKIGEQHTPKPPKISLSFKKLIARSLAEMTTEQAVYPFSIVEHPSFRSSVRKTNGMNAKIRGDKDRC